MSMRVLWWKDYSSELNLWNRSTLVSFDTDSFCLENLILEQNFGSEKKCAQVTALFLSWRIAYMSEWVHYILALFKLQTKFKLPVK